MRLWNGSAFVAACPRAATPACSSSRCAYGATTAEPTSRWTSSSASRADLRTRYAPKLDDRGVTLTELLVAIAILAIIIVPLSHALIGFVRNTDPTTRRMSESHDIQVADVLRQGRAERRRTGLVVADFAPAAVH